MNLESHYATLWKQSYTGFREGNFEIDHSIDSSTDRRLGITLLARPDQAVIEELQQLLSRLKAIDPAQYYYPSADMHLTVLSIISCYQDFDLAMIDMNAYKMLVANAVQNCKSFGVTFKGITASPSCIMIQGFPQDDTLLRLRDMLRTQFKASGLQHSIDKRYTIQTAHSTVVRFRTQLKNQKEYLHTLEAYKEHFFGPFIVDELELVCNDWYQRKEKVKILERFALK